jgi:hypothetical protein
MVCSKMFAEDGETEQAGRYAVQAIREFLGTETAVSTSHQGFVIDHESGERVDVPRDDEKTWQSKLKELGYEQWVRKEPLIDYKDWVVSVPADDESAR